jgi:peptidyl-prolyl cis-trans isomerase SurA
LRYHVKDILLALPEAPSTEILKKTTAQALELRDRLSKGLDFETTAVALSSGNVALKGGDLGLRSLASLPVMFAERLEHMKVGDVSKPIRASNGLHLIKLIAIEGENKAQMVQLTHVKHILLKSSPSVLESEAKKNIEHIALQVKQGKTFESLATTFSDDSVSAKQGGDLGWLHQGETVPEFEKAFNALKVGQVSAPVKTAFGWHLIKMVGRKKIDDSETFEKQKIKQALYQRKFGEAVQNWLQQIRTTAYIKTFI